MADTATRQQVCELLHHLAHVDRPLTRLETYLGKSLFKFYAAVLEEEKRIKSFTRQAHSSPD